MFENIESLHDLPKEIIKELEDFFIDYNKIEGKEFKVLEKMEAKDSWKVFQGNFHTAD
jgi:inorganic pyrophosphatase